MSDPFIGEIRTFGGNFAPKGWALCQGQLLAINQNQALFSLLGTTFGGNGMQNFALPNLQGRLPIGQGQGPGLTNRTLGEVGGSEAVTLLLTNLPTHSHMLNATKTPVSSASVGPTLLTGAPTATNTKFYALPSQTPPPPTPFNLAGAACGISGQSQAHSNLMPSLCVTFIIALQGIFPSRN
jgi:microcystin-dependent protein